MSVNPELLKILVCPETKAPLVLQDNNLISTDPETRRRYRIENDIPVMLIDESEQMDKAEWESIMKEHGKI